MKILYEKVKEENNLTIFNLERFNSYSGED